MPIMLQVRNLPDDVHAKLKARAAEARMSLSDYVAQQLAELVRYRSNAELFAEAQRRSADMTPAEKEAESVEISGWIRQERDRLG